MLDVTTDNFVGVTSFQYSINWDPALISFTGLANINSTDINDFNAGAFNTNNANSGNLSVSWFDGTTVGQDLSNGIVLYQMCFDVISTDATTVNVNFSGTPTGQEVTTATGGEVMAVYNNGTVTSEGGGEPGESYILFSDNEYWTR